MSELRELHHRDVDDALQDWTQMVRAACRVLVLNADAGDAVTVAATFGDYAMGLDSAEVAIRLVAEYGLVVDATVGAYVSMRISRPHVGGIGDRERHSGEAQADLHHPEVVPFHPAVSTRASRLRPGTGGEVSRA